MLNQLSRPEEVNIKNDIHEIAKSLATISSTLTDLTITEATEKKDSIVDSFFGGLYVSDDHLDAVYESYDCNGKMACVGLMEECSELIQALSKLLRYNVETIGERHIKLHVLEEMAHVIICIRLVCYIYKIEPNDIQKEIMKKYPEAYEERTK